MIAVRNGGRERRRARLVGFGAHVPDRIVTNDEIAEYVDTSDEWIVERTGIRERRFVADDEAASDLGVIAAQRILDDAGRLRPDHLMLLVGFGAGLTWGSTIVRYEPR